MRKLLPSGISFPIYLLPTTLLSLLSCFIGKQLWSHRSLGILQYIVLRRKSLGASNTEVQPLVYFFTICTLCWRAESLPKWGNILSFLTICPPPSRKKDGEKKKKRKKDRHMHTYISLSCFSLQRAKAYRVLVNNKEPEIWKVRIMKLESTNREWDFKLIL